MKSISQYNPPLLPFDGMGGSIPIFVPDTDNTIKKTATVGITSPVVVGPFSPIHNLLVRVVSTGNGILIGVTYKPRNNVSPRMPIMEGEPIELLVLAGCTITLQILDSNGDDAEVYITPSKVL